MLTSRPNRINDFHGGKQWTAGNADGWPHAFYMAQGRRPYMEDTFDFGMMRGSITFFGVYDGHAGVRAINMLKDKLVASLDAGLNGMEFERRDTVNTTIKKVVQQLDDVFVKEAKEHKFHDGSTATTTMIQGSNLVCANVGDSRTILCRLGQAMPLSIDHKPTRPEERDRIIASGGTISTVGVPRVNGILATSRTIGDGSMKIKQYIICEPEITHHKIQPGDEYVIMASDGIWDMLTNQQVCEICCKHSTPAESCKALVDESLKRGGNDNMTVAIIDLRSAFSNEPPPLECVSNTALSSPSYPHETAGEAHRPLNVNTAVEPDYEGFLLKQQQNKGVFGQAWQKRWFTLSKHIREEKYEASMHNNWSSATYVLQYFNDQSSARKPGPGRKPIFLDSSYPARREVLLDSNGRNCFSVRDLYSGKVIVLGGQAGNETMGWIGAINLVFETQKWGGGSRGGSVHGSYGGASVHGRDAGISQQGNSSSQNTGVF